MDENRFYTELDKLNNLLLEVNLETRENALLSKTLKDQFVNLNNELVKINEIVRVNNGRQSLLSRMDSVEYKMDFFDKLRKKDEEHRLIKESEFKKFKYALIIALTTGVISFISANIHFFF